MRYLHTGGGVDLVWGDRELIERLGFCMEMDGRVLVPRYDTIISRRDRAIFRAPLLCPILSETWPTLPPNALCRYSVHFVILVRRRSDMSILYPLSSSES